MYLTDSRQNLFAHFVLRKIQKRHLASRNILRLLNACSQVLHLLNWKIIFYSKDKIFYEKIIFLYLTIDMRILMSSLIRWMVLFISLQGHWYSTVVGQSGQVGGGGQVAHTGHSLIGHTTGEQSPPWMLHWWWQAKILWSTHVSKNRVKIWDQDRNVKIKSL